MVNTEFIKKIIKKIIRVDGKTINGQFYLPIFIFKYLIL